VRRLLWTLALGLVLASPATAAPPAVTVAASPTTGIGLVDVTLTAAGDVATYHWDLGDGTSADGPSVKHTYRTGTWTAVVTATAASGETAQASTVVRVAPHTVSLAGPREGAFGSRLVLRGRIGAGWGAVPVQIYRGRTFVGRAETARGGTFRVPILLRRPGTYHARFGRVRSQALTIRVVPRLTASLDRTAPLGGTLTVRARVEPSKAGVLEARAGGRWRRVRAGKITFAAARVGPLRVVVRLRPSRGFVAASRTLAARVVQPSLAQGASGPGVLELERRLAELRFALPAVDARYDLDTIEAVYAFQQLHGLAPTGRVDGALWRLLARATVPRARFPGTHLEVDKGRQVLLDVRDGLVVRVVHISTGATGNTPLGTWHVYRKVPGYDWVLYYPLYFLRGFAVHGYPSVPPYPASHGCVRVPMWIARSLYDAHGYGTTVVVY
jgi:N-acetylmuramoyl-L-alanine amidase